MTPTELTAIIRAHRDAGHSKAAVPIEFLEDLVQQPKLTPRQKQVLDALDGEFTQPGIIANRARIRTVSPRETASKFCIQLTRLGLAEKGGTPMFPKWRRKP